MQRDYVARIEGAKLRPSELMALVRRRFGAFAPEELAAFRCPDGDRELRVKLGTLAGHPEAGRITFGSCRDDSGEILFHIRSRARSDSLLRLLGFVVAAEAMQTNTWADFISRVAAVAGGSARAVHAKMQTIDDDGEEEAMDRPTFLARGD